MALFALNLFDLAPNDDYRAYSKRSADAVGKHGGAVLALGRLAGAAEGEVEPRQVMVLVEWPSREAFDAFVADPELADLHPLREHGTERYLWWLYDRLDDLRPLLAVHADDLVVRAAERTIGVDPAAVWDLAADPARMAEWFEGVERVTVEGRPGQGQNHVASGPEGDVRRVTEDWEPQGLVRWRDVAEPAGAWLELCVAPSGTGAHVRLEDRRVLEGDPEVEARLRASLERLAAVLHG